MATVARQVIRVASERQFFTGMALALLATAFVGFAPTYYLSVPMHAKPLPWLVHLHGMACSAWILLLVAQTSLVAAGRRDLHRRLGVMGVVTGVVIVALGLMVALHALRHGRVNAGSLPPLTLLAVQFTTIGLFAGFATLGVVNRANAAAHKRLMLLATIAMTVPALSRIARMLHIWPLPPNAIGGMILSNLFLIALATYDWRTRGRLHPVTLWGGLFYILWEPLRIVIGLSRAWQDFAGSVFA
jgi:uncharacterized membrane protein YozB (DUF420 family)